MRVLFYLGDKQWSACARGMLAVARGLKGREHQITIAGCDGGRLNALAQEAGLETVTIDAAVSAAGGVLDLRKSLHERFVEVVVVTTERDQLVVSSAMRLAERGAVLRRVPSFDRFELQRSGKLALKIASAGLIVTTERELKAINLAGWSIPAAVVPIGVDAASYDAIEPAARGDFGVPSQGLLIACSYNAAGRLRLATVFRTLSLLAPRHPNMHVVVIGPSSLEEDLRMHAAALGVGPVFTFLGEREDELKIMRAADVGWVAAEGDGAAYACLDFMGLRMPVIAERTPLTQHYVADGISGLLLSPGDSSHTASEVAEFLAGAENRAAMGNAGRTRVQRDFTDTAMIAAAERAVDAAGDRTKWTTSA
jgi:glycosyltransferase involved in cell wall biosynthesis